MNMKKSVLIAVAALGIGFLSNNVMAQTQQTDTTKTAPATTPAAPAAASGDVVGVLSSTTDFAPLALAVKTADLEPELKGPGPFTVFAPNDVAFSKVPKPTM
jgi:uncharacterized surface protein with fasciclin (FAS1) repeats